MSAKNPKDLPLTRGQAIEIFDELMRVIGHVRHGTTIADATWARHLETLRSIAMREPPKPEAQPFQPVEQTWNDLRRQRANLADEQSMAALRNARS